MFWNVSFRSHIHIHHPDFISTLIPTIRIRFLIWWWKHNTRDTIIDHTVKNHSPCESMQCIGLRLADCCTDCVCVRRDRLFPASCSSRSPFPRPRTCRPSSCVSTWRGTRATSLRTIRSCWRRWCSGCRTRYDAQSLTRVLRPLAVPVRTGTYRMYRYVPVPVYRWQAD